MIQFIVVLLAAVLLSAFTNFARSQQVSQREILDRNARGIVFLSVKNKDGKEVASGSGFIVSTDGYVLTVSHLKVEPDQKLFAVVGQREGPYFPLSFRGKDEQSDLALWQFPQSATCRQAVSLSTKKVSALDPVMALGFPGSSGLTPSILSVTNLQTGRGFLRTDGFLEPGNSGGPVFNQSGDAVGVVHGGGSPGTDNNEIIPIGLAGNLLTKWSVSVGLDRQPEYPEHCYASCRVEAHGIEGWGSSREWGPANSGWLPGGHNQIDECNKLVAAELAKPENRGGSIEVSRRWEDSKKDWGHAQYKYWCEGTLRLGPIYYEKRSAACGLWQ